MFTKPGNVKTATTHIETK